ncbi:ABC transporter permease [Amphibacillus sp. Q70]|uniref:ABC transporter permease n=1 Tax=Amphibacillus sp. Q70 TaxID=3453416 RepID=UPI003F857A82
MKKIKSKRFLYLLVLVPILAILLVFTYSIFTNVDFQSQETVKANQLLNDLNWRLASYSQERGYYGENQNQLDNPEELSENDQAIFELLDEAERERFNYSVASYYEDWSDLNLSKQKIWDNLIEVVELGGELLVLDEEELLIDKYHIDWLVEYQVDTLDVNSDQNSQFVLFNSFQWLFSLPAMILMIFFFSLAMFLEPKRSIFNFTRVLPVSYAKVMGHKLMLFFAMLITYILSIIGGSLLVSLFDSISLKGQLNYPLVVHTGTDILVKPLWQMLSFQILFFIGLTLLSLLLISLFTQLFQNELFVTFIFTAVILIGSQITRLSSVANQVYSPFAWYDTANFIQNQSVATIFTVLGVLYLSVILLVWFVLLKDLPLPNWRRSANYTGIRKLSKRFLIHFEGLKIHRQAILFYSSAVIMAFAIYLGVAGYQHQKIQIDQVRSDYSEQLDRYQEMLPQHYETEEMLEQHLAAENLDNTDAIYLEMELENLRSQIAEDESNLAMLLEIDEKISNDEFDEVNQPLSQIESEYLEEDYLFLTGSEEIEFSQTIPMNHFIFMPNAYINYQLSEWKQEHEIDFVPPGGPYHTLFIPTYEESPRSGDMEPPLSIDRAVFDSYLDTVDQEHRYLSGFNLLADIFNQYFYLVILILLVGFYSLSYVREWDGQETIRYLIVQPIGLTRIFIAKMLASIGMGFCFILLASLIIFLVGSLLNGVGQLNFPFVQYIADSIGLSNPDQYFEIPLSMNYFQIVPLWKWLMMGAALLLSNVLLLNQLVYYLSTFSRNQWIVMGSSLFILGAGYVLTILWPHYLLQFSPFQYLDIAKTLSGEVAVQHDYTWLNWWVGVISQSIASVVLTILALRRVQKKENA